MARKFQEGLSTDDMNTLVAPAMTMVELFGKEGAFEGLAEDAMNLMNDMPNLGVQDSKNLTENGTQIFHSTAKNFEERINAYREQNPDRLGDAPRTKAFQDGMLDFYKQEFQNVQNGFSLKQNPQMLSPAAFGMQAVFPQLNNNIFKPENVQKTEEALKDYPLDRFFELGNKMHDSHTFYERYKDQRTDRQNALHQEEMREQKQEFLDLSKDLYQKAQNPSKETVGLFGKEQYLTGPEGFRGNRGLETVIENLEKDLSMSSSKEMKGLEDSLKKFNTSRAAIFRKESDEHKNMREATEKVQENLKKLKEDTVIDKQTGKSRAMTSDERAQLKKETMDAINKMDEMTDAYINHASPNGKEPSTGAGKERLAGAKELKKFATEMKERFADDPAVKNEIVEEKAAAKRAEWAKQAPGRARKYIERKEKKYAQFEGMSKNLFWGASRNPVARDANLNDFQFMAAEQIALSAVKEGMDSGAIDPDNLAREHERATKKMVLDPNFQKWAEGLKDVKRQEEVGKMSRDEIRNDFVKSISKEMDRTNNLTTDKQKTKNVQMDEKSKKSPQKTEKKVETKTKNKKTPVKQPIEQDGMTR